MVHFFADLHQLFHAIANDRGGIDVMLQFFGRQINPHKVSDVDLIERAYSGQEMLQEQVLATLEAVNWRGWQVRHPQN